MYHEPSPPSAFTTLPAILRALMGAVGAWAGRGWLSTALSFLLYARVSLVCRKMERLIGRYQAGRLWRGRTGARAVPVRKAGPVGPRIWPVRFGWLVRAASYHAVGYGSQLRAALETPEMVALLEAAPQAGRILRPICRALGIEAAVLRPLVPAPELGLMGGATLTHPTVPRASKPRPEPFRIPLPRGVISAARREGFGKLK